MLHSVESSTTPYIYALQGIIVLTVLDLQKNSLVIMVLLATGMVLLDKNSVVHVLVVITVERKDLQLLSLHAAQDFTARKVKYNNVIYY